MKSKIITLLTLSVLVISLVGCSKDEDESTKGKEENGVHKPKDKTFSSDEKKDIQEQADQ